MSNKEIVESIYEAHRRGDTAAVFAALDPEVEIRQSPAVPWGGAYRGLDGAMEFFTRLGSHIDTQVEIERLIETSDAVIEIGRTRGRAIATGREFSIEETHVWRIQDGKVVGMEAFVDEQAMLAAISV